MSWVWIFEIEVEYGDGFSQSEWYYLKECFEEDFEEKVEQIKEIKLIDDGTCCGQNRCAACSRDGSETTCVDDKCITQEEFEVIDKIIGPLAYADDLL